ncbi:hypothetical protein ACQKLG_17495 [Pedobacter suwonensis]|uniref:hypothetical protein n=1 Tax=Pedobacter suwonensis TaxID=332999 RepID=UPI003802BDB6
MLLKIRIPLLIIYSFTIIGCGQHKSQDFDLNNEVIKDAVDNINKKLEERDDLLFTTYLDEGKKIINPSKSQHRFTLVFKGSITNCETCVDQVIYQLANEAWSKKINLQVWLDNPDIEQTALSRPWYKVKNKLTIKTISRNMLSNLECDKINKPYFFLLDTTYNTVSSIYFPELKGQEKTKKYLDIILQKLNDQKN